MRLTSYVISLCLHIGVFLLIWYWPASPPPRLDLKPITISLVEGEPGGSRTPSPILGHLGDTGEGQLAPTPPAPQSEVAAPAREEIKVPQNVPAPPQPAPEQIPEKIKPVEEPEKKPEPVAEKAIEIPKAEPKKEEPPKPEPKKPEPPKTESKKPEPPQVEQKKPEPKKTPPAKPKKAPPKLDPIAAALQQARKATSRVQSGDRGSAVEQALAQAQRSASGTRGGGGGEGAGPGGGGIGDVYIGQVMLAVRPNWGFASAGRKNLVCVVKVNVDMQGKVQRAEISQSSGNAQYDASAVNAIIRTSNAGDFPPPPNPGLTDLDIVFTLNELAGR